MPDLKRITGFEWDKWNLDKSYKKHGISPKEAEEIFLDNRLLQVDDIKHSQIEKRFVAVGKTVHNKILFISFTIRNKKIRVISARKANKKERNEYGKEIK